MPEELDDVERIAILARDLADILVFPFLVLTTGFALDLPVLLEFPVNCAVVGFMAYSYARCMEVYREVRESDE